MNTIDLSGSPEPESSGNREVDPERRKTAVEVYQQTWTDFYIWEQNLSQTALTSLGVIEHRSGPIEPLEQDDHDQEFHPELMNSEGTDTFTVEHYDETGECIRYATITPTDYPITYKNTPHPKYEICTPASQNHAQATTIYNYAAAFIPYVDDPDFPVLEYLEDFEEFSWQTDFDDPDVEVIQLEAVRRLHLHHDFSFKEIDELGLFPPLRDSSDSPVRGLLWSTAQRDIPWRGLAEYLDPQVSALPWNFTLKTPDLFATINQDIPDFCPNLNCLRTFCPTHRPHKYPPVDPVKPKLTSTDLKSSKGRPCGEDCFRYIDEDEDEEDFSAADIFWENEDDVTTLQSILKLMPDQAPCDLAVICRKPCREVFEYRCRLLPDDSIVDELYQEERPSRFIMPQFVDLKDEGVPTFTPLFPCHHKGPCDQNSTCPCYMEGQHCQRNCRCDLECPIRWEGCHCRPTIHGTACKDSEYCICRQTGRECDPEMCTGCDARRGYCRSYSIWSRTDCISGRTKRNPPCRNVDLQRGIPKAYINVTRGSYGLGACARVDIGKDVVIGEYAAEILSTKVAQKGGVINDHTGLNYVFDLNPSRVLDSIRLGNDTRYLNDARPFGIEGDKENNCAAVVRLVNGDHRIAIFTKKPVMAGEELFLDYGEKYWIHDSQHHGNRKRSNSSDMEEEEEEEEYYQRSLTEEQE